jgi:hypothetical protein
MRSFMPAIGLALIAACIVSFVAALVARDMQWLLAAVTSFVLFAC